MTTFEELDRDEVDESIHAVLAEVDTTFTWDYERSRPGLSRLYEKAKGSQWNASTDLDWSIDVDPERVSADLGGGSGSGRFGHLARLGQGAGQRIAQFGSTGLQKTAGGSAGIIRAEGYARRGRAGDAVAAIPTQFAFFAADSKGGPH
mgnify:CR=1 FL=1